jgi:uncharacterized protein YqeY
LRKIIKDNHEEIASRGDNPQYVEAVQKLNEENKFLSRFLPQCLSEDQIREILLPHFEQLKGAKDDGAATGMAMRVLKPQGEYLKLSVDGSLVREVVSAIRKEQ